MASSATDGRPASVTAATPETTPPAGGDAGGLDFSPELTPDELDRLGVTFDDYSADHWPEGWARPVDRRGWLDWYRGYHAGERSPGDAKMIAAWRAARDRLAAGVAERPTGRRAAAMLGWALNPVKHVPDDQAESLLERIEAFRNLAGRRGLQLRTKHAGALSGLAAAQADPRDPDGIDVTADAVEYEPWADLSLVGWYCSHLGRPPAEKIALAAADLAAAGRVVDPKPTEAQRDAGNYAKGEVRWKGLRVTIENPKGSVRRGRDWSQRMNDSYGYFNGYVGRDGDQVDVFVCDEDLDSELVFVVNSTTREGKFDEHKVVIGVTNEAKAREVYSRNYPAGWKGLGSVKAMTLVDFKDWLEHGDLSKMAAEKTYTVAVDFDGTLATKVEPFNPKKCGEPVEWVVRWVKAFKEAGAKIIVWTCRGNTDPVEEWLEEHGIPCDHVNEHPGGHTGSPKVYADVYIDDRGVHVDDLPKKGREILEAVYKKRGEDPPKRWADDEEWAKANAAQEEKNQSSKLKHVREGYMTCQYCDERWHHETPDRKCPGCGLDSGGVRLRGVKRGGALGLPAPG